MKLRLPNAGNLGAFVRQGARQALLSRALPVVEAVVIFVVLFAILAPLGGALAPAAGLAAVAGTSALIAVAAAMALGGLNRRIRPVIDRRFFRAAHDTERILIDLSEQVRALADRPADVLSQELARTIGEALGPRHVAVFGGRVGPRGEGRTRRGDAVYPCVALLRASGAGVALRPDPDATAGLSFLAADPFVTALRERAAGGAQPFEVDFADTRSWIGRLKADPSEALQRLEALDPRLIVPFVTQERLVGFVALGEKLSREPYNRDDRTLLRLVAEQTAVALDYATLIARVKEQEGLRREMAIARDVQARLFPQRRVALGTLDYAAVCRAAQDVGGDYYDFFALEPGIVTLAVGDVSGKGISAALLMASLQALIRSHAAMHGDRVDRLLADVNRQMTESTDAARFATLFCAVYTDATRTLSYASAGHNPPMLLRNGRIERLQPTGMAIGLFEHAAYERRTLTLEPGDLLVLFTDGATEAVNGSGEEYGEDRLAAAAATHASRPAGALCEALLADLERFTDNARQSDDITLLVAKVA